MFDKHARNHLPAGAKKVHGHLHATTSTGGDIVLYDAEGATVTISAGERLMITSAMITVSVGGDTVIYVDADAGNDVDVAEVVIRGTLANNGTLQAEFSDPWIAQKGADPRCVCASGTVDATLTGYVMRA